MNIKQHDGEFVEIPLEDDTVVPHGDEGEFEYDTSSGDEFVDNSNTEPYDYVQFKNEVLTLIYDHIPSYAYFYEGTLEADLNDGYWHGFSEEECKSIIQYFMQSYLGTNTDVFFETENPDCKSLLIDLLLDYF